MARHYLRGLFALLLGVLLTGCGLLDAHDAGVGSYDKQVKIAVAPSPTDTSLPITTTPSPATNPFNQGLSPTNTALPTVVPTQESDPGQINLSVTLEPEVVSQGKVLVISIWARPGLTITGILGSQELIFMNDGSRYWCLAGIAPSHEVGMQTLWLKATDSSGQIKSVAASFQVARGDFPIERIKLPPGQLQLLDPALVEAEMKELQSHFSRFTLQKMWQGLFVMPTEGPVSSAFGTQRSYNGGPVSGYHQGMDIEAPEGAPVVAANDGVIVFAQRLRLRGNAIVIDHGVGVYSGYYHLSEIEVAEGESVKKGQVIGRVGETGMATGPHLHWEMRIRENSVEPLEWIEREIGL